MIWTVPNQHCALACLTLLLLSSRISTDLTNPKQILVSLMLQYGICTHKIRRLVSHSVFAFSTAAEMQAIDRTHRLGQHRCIRAVRFIAEGTVEERVLQLQEKKRLVFDGTVGRDAGSLKMLTVDDMHSLFQ